MSISVPSFGFLPQRLPSYTSILLSLLASLVFLFFIRAAFLCLRHSLQKKMVQYPQAQVEEKTTGEMEAPRQRRSSWTWGLLSWESISSVSLGLPVTLTAVDKETIGRGVGMKQRQEERPVQRWQHQRVRRGGPAFETPRSYMLLQNRILILSPLSSSIVPIRRAALDGENDHVETCSLRSYMSGANHLTNFLSPDIQETHKPPAISCGDTTCP